MRLTRRVMDLFAEGKSDEDAERALFREGVPVDRARSIVAEVRRVQRRIHGPDLEPDLTARPDADLLERLRELERAARPLEPGVTRRRVCATR